MKSQLLVGAALSGSGKTTFTAGLLLALRKRGLKVQPFKCGPDYIDTKLHMLAAGAGSVNLDTYMASPEHVKYLYGRYGNGAEVCVTEGVMGLFDGFDGMKGSSAELANLLKIPVVLLVNSQSTAYSVAPLIYGYKHFYKGIRIAGVVFNKVASPSHCHILEQACRDVRLDCLGCLPMDKSIELPLRHQGLTLDEKYRFLSFAEKIAELVETHVDIDRLLDLSLYPFNATTPGSLMNDYKGLRIAVANDEAFNFTYRENIRQLERLGDVFYFSPLLSETIPDADLVYLPGGYPEFFLPQLSRNVSMLNSLKEYAEAGGKILAECGGMIYLCRSITGTDGIKYLMAGILNQEATMTDIHLKEGYRNFKYQGVAWRGHEFHYSHLESPDPSVAIVYNSRGEVVSTPLFRYKNVIAGYTHLYWGEQDILDLFRM